MENKAIIGSQLREQFAISLRNEKRENIKKKRNIHNKENEISLSDIFKP